MNGGVIVEGRGLTKVFGVGDAEVHALRGVDVAVGEGEFVALVGPSGSGKSTLLHVIGLVTRPTTGSVWVGGKDTSRLNDAEVSALRLRDIGFIFQTFNLLPQLNAEQNVSVVMQLAGVKRGERRERARALLDSVGLARRMTHRPAQLSGGERQRVAIARALANRPRIILADEPTGNLDTTTGEGIVAILERLHAEGMTLVLVTHNDEIAGRASRRLVIRDGRMEGVVD